MPWPLPCEYLLTRISEIVHVSAGEIRRIPGVVAGALFWDYAGFFWMKMQVSYDLALASREVTARIEIEIFPAPRGKSGELKARQIA